MTGFARVEGSTPAGGWVWEARSVNARGRDFRFSLPPGLGRIEGALRRIAAERFSRGSFGMDLRIRNADAVASHRVDRGLLESLIALVRECRGGGDVAVEALLGVNGVVRAAPDGGNGADDDEIAAGFVRVVEALQRCREEEGAELERVAGALVDEISELAARASELAPRGVEERASRLRARIGEVLAGGAEMSEDRFAQEVAAIVARGDVREEIDRLDAHVAAVRALLGEGGAVGRRLDFLCQELNREANTLCSKSSSLDLTRAGIDLKAAIERLREQVQNIE